jgi:hypothetical protein
VRRTPSCCAWSTRWLICARTVCRFHTAFAEALAKAVEATVEELGKVAAKGEKITAVRQLMGLWYRTADKSLLVTFNKQEFLDKQNAFTKAQQQFKLAQRAVVEDIFRGLDMPTRSELDEDLSGHPRTQERGPGAQEGTAFDRTCEERRRASQGRAAARAKSE